MMAMGGLNQSEKAVDWVLLGLAALLVLLGLVASAYVDFEPIIRPPQPPHLRLTVDRFGRKHQTMVPTRPPDAVVPLAPASIAVAFLGLLGPFIIYRVCVAICGELGDSEGRTGCWVATGLAAFPALLAFAAFFGHDPTGLFDVLFATGVVGGLSLAWLVSRTAGSPAEPEIEWDEVEVQQNRTREESAPIEAAAGPPGTLAARTEPPPHETAAPPEGSRRTAASTSAQRQEQVCLLCNRPIEPDASVLACTACGQTYHAECIARERKCLNPACPRRASEETPVSAPPTSAAPSTCDSGATQDAVLCPHCDRPVDPTRPAFHCPECGATNHGDCWLSKGGCGTPGCRNAPKHY